MAALGQRLLKLLCRVPRSRRIIADLGGAEAMVTSFLASLKRMRATHVVSAEQQKIYDDRCQEVDNRLNEVAMCTEANELARIQSMRGLRQAKRDYIVTQEKLEGAKERLESAKTVCHQSRLLLEEKQVVQYASEAHMQVLLTLSLIHI